MMALMMCFTMVSFGQEKYSSYDQTYGSENFEIAISGDSTNFKIYVNAYSLDRSIKNGGVILDTKTLEGFTQMLKNAKGKYIEWVDIAKQNKITEMSKPMEYKTKCKGFFSYGTWQFDYSVTLTSRFKILETKNLLLLDTQEMVSETNQFMKCDGFAFIFSDVKEIDNLLLLLSKEELKKFFEKPKKEDLFKN